MSELSQNELELSPEDEAYLAQVRKRRKRIIIGVAVAAVICGTAVAVRYAQIERNIAQKRAEALDHLRGTPSLADVEIAIGNLTDVVQRHPHDIDALSTYAKASLLRPLPNRQQVSDSVRAYLQLLEIDAKRNDDRRDLVFLLDQLGESEAVVRFGQPLVDAEYCDTEVLQLYTLHLVRLRRNTDAQKIAERWVQNDPANARAYVTLLSIYKAIGKDQSAPDSYLNAVLPTLEQNDAALLARSVWKIESGARAEGEALLNALLSRPQWDRRLARYVLFSLDQLGRDVDAEKIIESLDSSDDEGLPSLLALRDLDRGRATKAQVRLQKASLPKDPSWRSVQICLEALLNFQLGQASDVAGAKEKLKAIPEQFSGPWLAVLEAQTNPSLDVSSARDLAGKMRISVRVEEAGAVVQVATALCLTVLNQQDNADQQLSNAMQMPVGWSAAAMRLISLRLSKDEPQRALEIAQIAFDRSGRSFESAVALALTAMQCHPTGSAADRLLELLQQIQKIAPGEPQTLGALVELLAERKDPTAKQVLSEALNSQAKVPSSVLLKWAEISRRWSLGLEADCVRRAESTDGLTPDVALAKALLQHKTDPSGDGLSVLVNARTNRPAEAKAFDLATATYLSLIGSRDALGAWQSLATKYPDDLPLLLRVLDSGTVQVPEQRKALIAAIRKLDASNPSAELADIRLSILEGGKSAMDNAMLRMNRLAEQHPGLVSVRLQMVDVLRDAGNDQGALKQWEAAKALAPENPSILLEGVSLFIRLGDRSRAEELVQPLNSMEASLPSQQRVAVAHAQLALGHAEAAARILESLPTRNKQESLLYAHALFQKGDTAAVNQVLGKLMVDPDFETILFAASVADAAGARAEADQLLLKAETLDSLNPDNKLRIAQVLTDRGASDRVIGFVAQGNVSDEIVIQIASRWAQRGNVEIAMSVLKEAAAKSKHPEVLQKRLELKDQLAALVQQQLPQIAARLIEAPDDLDTQQLVEFAQKTPSQTIRQQQEALDQLAERSKDSFIAQMFLAERYRAANQPVRAERAARLAGELQKAAPQPWAFTAISQFQSENYGGCIESIQQWRNRLPADSTIPDVLEARALAKSRDFHQLLDRFEPLIRSGRPLPNELILLVAQAMVSRGRFAEANALTRQIIEQDSTWSINWMHTISQDVDPDLAARALDAIREIKEKRSLPGENVEFALTADHVARRSRSAVQLAAAADLLRALANASTELPTESIVRICEHFFEENDPDKAEEFARIALLTRDDSAPIWRALGHSLRLQKKYKEALKAVDRAIALSNRSPLAHEIRCEALLALGQKSEALAAAQAAAKMDPLNPEQLLRLAQMQMELGQAEEAKAMLPTLDWFFREQSAWPAEVISQFRALRAALVPPATQETATSTPS